MVRSVMPSDTSQSVLQTGTLKDVCCTPSAAGRLQLNIWTHYERETRETRLKNTLAILQTKTGNGLPVYKLTSCILDGRDDMEKQITQNTFIMPGNTRSYLCGYQRDGGGGE